MTEAEKNKDNQIFLKDRGFYKGVIDGDFGPASRKAYQEFLIESNAKQSAIAKAKGYPHDNNDELIAFYGTPEQAENKLVSVPFPWISKIEGKVVKGIRIHQKIANDLKLILDDVWEFSGKNQSVIDSWGLSTYDGSYNNRPVRGGSRLSQHAFGAAIDFDAEDNPNSVTTGNRALANMPEKVIQIWANHGWMNGGRKWGRDFMHYSACQ